MKLSERQTAALCALAKIDGPATGRDLACAMSAYWRPTSVAAAHQAGAGLAHKGLAQKGNRTEEGHIRYEITDLGRQIIAGEQA